MSVFPIARRIACAVLLSVGLLTGASSSAGIPGFVSGPIHSPNAASVAAIVPTDAADVVLLDGGLESGLRLGMVCRVDRGPSQIGELIIIESQSDRAAGLILSLVDTTIIRPGDVARVKTLPTS